MRRLAGSGLRIALVERELVGGECAYWACVPAKTLLRPPDARFAARRIQGLEDPRESWPEVARYRDTMISNLDDTDKAAKMEEAGAEVVRGVGAIAGPGRVNVGERTLEADDIVIATGTETAVPPIDGIDEIEYWTNRELYTMQTLPRDAIVLGGGPVGIESAQMLRRHGSGSALVEEAERLLAREDPAIGDELAPRLSEEGIDVRTGVRATRARAVPGGVELCLDDDTTLEAERLIVATGRKPCTDGLGLDLVGVRTSKDGGIEIDEQCRAAKGVWAVGDVTALQPFTHVAHYQGEIVADTILGRPRRADYRAIPRVVFSDPEVAAVGLTSQEAGEQGIEIACGSVDLQTLARTGMYGTGYRGSATVLADRNARVLVGAYAIGPLASEWIGAVVLAIKARIPLDVLRDTTVQFPTFGESLRYAVDAIDV